MVNLITPQQIKVIKMIEENLEIKFTGETREDAISFIANNMIDSQAVSKHYKTLIREHYGGYKKVWRLLKDIDNYRKQIVELRGETHMSCPKCHEDCISWVASGAPCKEDWQI